MKKSYERKRLSDLTLKFLSDVNDGHDPHLSLMFIKAK